MSDVEEIQNMIEQYGWRRQIQGLWAERNHFDPRHQRSIDQAAETRKKLNGMVQSLFPAAALALDPPPADSLTVRIDADGAAHLRAVDGETVVGITVPKEKRREIAADIFGPVTHEDVQRIAGECGSFGSIWVSDEEIVRDVLRAFFGEPA